MHYWLGSCIPQAAAMASTVFFRPEIKTKAKKGEGRGGKMEEKKKRADVSCHRLAVSVHSHPPFPMVTFSPAFLCLSAGSGELELLFIFLSYNIGTQLPCFHLSNPFQPAQTFMVTLGCTIEPNVRSLHGLGDPSSIPTDLLHGLKLLHASVSPTTQ